jgi:hypothetical protein
VVGSARERRERYLIFISSQKGKILTHYSAVIFTLLLQTRREEQNYFALYFFIILCFLGSIAVSEATCVTQREEGFTKTFNILMFKLHTGTESRRNSKNKKRPLLGNVNLNNVFVFQLRKLAKFCASEIKWKATASFSLSINTFFGANQSLL